jgi:phosphoglycerate kinase
MYEAMKALVPGIAFCPMATGPEARSVVREMAPGGVLMLENLRRNPGEEKNDPAFAHALASLADIFVQDSFDVCHRKHASVVGVPALLPSYAGLTVEAEVKELSRALKPKKPSFAVIAGAKFATKEPVLQRLLKSYDRVAVGGALANDFIHAQGYSVGASLVSMEGQEHIKSLLKHKKLVVPKDAIVAKKGAKRAEARVAELSDIRPDEMILDLGPKSQAELAGYAAKAKSVVWNGPLGLFEDGFTDATYALARAIASGKARSVLGGGDTIAAVEALGISDRFSFVSTGGGAMLDFIADGTLPGIEALSRR